MRHAAGFMATGAAALAALFVTGAVWAGPNREVTEANALYGAGNYQEALDAYERLAGARPESPELQFNRGAAHYQLGDLAKAREAFEQAGALAEDARFQALSAYNLGNCAFKEGQAKAAENPEEALTSLDQSVGYYKDALARDESLDAAANNLELAKRSIQKLRQQMEQQKQQQQQEQQKKEEAKEKLDELIEEQQQQQEQSEQAAQQQEQQKQDPTQPAPSQEQMEAMKEQQEKTRDKTEDLAEQMPGTDKPNPEQDAKASAAAAAEKQAEAEEHLKNQNAEDASKAQEEALEKLKEARKALDAEEEQKEQQSGKDQDAQDGKTPSDEQKEPKPQNPEAPQEKPGDDQKPEEAQSDEDPDDATPAPDATAKDILNQEKQNKELRNLQRMIGIAPVEKDW